MDNVYFGSLEHTRFVNVYDAVFSRAVQIRTVGVFTQMHRKTVVIILHNSCINTLLIFHVSCMFLLRLVNGDGGTSVELNTNVSMRCRLNFVFIYRHFYRTNWIEPLEISRFRHRRFSRKRFLFSASHAAPRSSRLENSQFKSHVNNTV